MQIPRNANGKIDWNRIVPMPLRHILSFVGGVVTGFFILLGIGMQKRKKKNGGRQ